MLGLQWRMSGKKFKLTFKTDSSPQFSITPKGIVTMVTGQCHRKLKIRNFKKKNFVVGILEFVFKKNESQSSSINVVATKH